MTARQGCWEVLAPRSSARTQSRRLHKSRPPPAPREAQPSAYRQRRTANSGIGPHVHRHHLRADPLQRVERTYVEPAGEFQHREDGCLGRLPVRAGVIRALNDVRKHELSGQERRQTECDKDQFGSCGPSMSLDRNSREARPIKHGRQSIAAEAVYHVYCPDRAIRTELLCAPHAGGGGRLSPI